MILVTDEDRDIINTTLSFSSVSDVLFRNNWTLTAVLNQFLEPLEAVGVVKTNQTYTLFQPTNEGSYFNTTVATAPFSSAFGSTYEDYSRLVEVAGGSVFTISKLRGGGTAGEALTRAFEDTIVKQLIQITN